MQYKATGFIQTKAMIKIHKNILKLDFQTTP
jgi:hypothetical protein